MSLSTLPPELIVLVAESLHPSAVLAFALTSRLCLQCSSDALRRQQQLATEYGVVSDLKPLTVPTLVRAVLSNPAVAFHIRSFESWGTRLGYHDWTAYDSRDSDADIDNADIIGPETLDVGTPPGKFWAQSELDYFKEYIINSLHAHWTNASDVVDSIAEGCDKPLKAVLFAHCPRLKDLSFVRFEEDDDPGTSPISALAITAFFIHHVLADLSSYVLTKWPAWPVGYQSLRSISVGIQTSLRPASWEDAYSIDARDARAISLLPNLETLSITGLQGRIRRGREGDGWGPDDMGNWDPPAGCSTVRHLRVAEVFGSADGIVELLGAFRSLKSASFNDCVTGRIFHIKDAETHRVLDQLAKGHANSLESLAFSYRGLGTCRAPWDCFVGLCEFEKLRYVFIDISDFNFESGAIDCATVDLEPVLSLFTKMLMPSLPSSLEELRISLWGSFSTGNAATALDSALLDFFQSGQCPKLNVIDLSTLCANLEEGAFVLSTSYGLSHGIDVVTSRTRSETLRPATDVPKRVIEQDLQTRWR